MSVRQFISFFQTAPVHKIIVLLRRNTGIVHHSNNISFTKQKAEEKKEIRTFQRAHLLQFLKTVSYDKV